MLGVIVCPRCTLVQGADLSAARVTCPRCGAKIDVKRAKVYFSTDSPQELAEGVRMVGAQLFYDIEDVTAAPPAMPQPRPGLPNDEQSMRALAVRLSENGDFSKEDVQKELRWGDEEAIERLLARMLDAGIIFESSPGRYRPA